MAEAELPTRYPKISIKENVFFYGGKFPRQAKLMMKTHCFEGAHLTFLPRRVFEQNFLKQIRFMQEVSNQLIEIMVISEMFMKNIFEGMGILGGVDFVIR